MSVKSFAKKRILIGVRDVRFCKVLADDAEQLAYAADVYKAPGLIEIGLAWSVTDKSIAADNVTVWEVINGLDSVEVTLTIAALGNDGQAFLGGHKRDATGGMIISSDDEAPYVAMGFASTRSDGGEDKAWFYKGKFKPSDETFRTKEKGQVNWQTPKVVGTFIPTIHDLRISHHISEGDPGVTEEVLNTYLDTVFMPTPVTKTIAITTEPENASKTAGNISGTLTVAATVTPSGTASYQWYQAEGPVNSGGRALSEETGYNTATLTIPTTLAAGKYYYYCVVSADGALPVASQVATVTVTAAA